MMFSCYLSSSAGIMQSLNPALVAEMSTLASSLHTAMATYGVVTDPVHGQIYAYKVDGCGSRTIMDDANIPSLLSTPRALSTKTPVINTIDWDAVSRWWV
jgi:meiotically up-regulated gene 157 (Mug157) protein